MKQNPAYKPAFFLKHECMFKKLVVVIFSLVAFFAKAQCPQVFDYLGNLSNKPYWISCTGSNYLLNFQSNSSWGAYTINWGDGSPQHSAANYVASTNITHNYASTVDTFVVTLNIPSLSCTLTGVVVMEKPVNASIQIPIGGVTQACAPATLQFINSSTDVSKTTKFVWNFGDGSPAVAFTYTNGGQIVPHTYSVGTVNCQTQVTLQANNYCTFGNPTIANFNPIQIYDKDQANITPSSILKCWPSKTFTFTNTTVRNCLAQGNVFQRQEYWNFGNYWGLGHDSIIGWKPWPPTSPMVISYPAPGTYTVLLRDSNLCGVSQQIITVNIVNPPTASLVVPSGTLCQNAPISFTKSSTPGYFYQWNFGAGGGFVPGALGAQQFSYPSAGTYTVRAVAFFPGGCSDTAKATITISPAPSANFTYSPSFGCNSLSGVNFTNTSVGAVSLNWAFGNGNTSTLTIPPSQSYTSVGVYTASLSTTGANSCVNTKTAAITVYQPPVAAFTPTSACLNTSTSFTSLSTSAPTNTIVSWSWNFGDGSANSALTNPVHTYTAVGTYTVKLLVSSAFCKDSVSLPVVINVRPVASFTPSVLSGCPTLSVNFNNGSQNANSYQWDFGSTPTATSTAINPSFVYNNTLTTSINPTISLIAFNSFGCSDTLKRSITVFPKPVANFTANVAPGCSPLAVTFTNTTTGATTYSWNFGDGNTSTSLSPSHTYTNATLLIQTYTAQLIAVSGNGCSDTVQQIITTYPKPLYSFTMVPSSGCHPLTVNFPPVLGAVSYNWDFGDGSTSASPNPVHTFTNISTSNVSYTVTLIAGNAFGCSDTAYGVPVVFAKPTANYSYTPVSGCAPLSVNFTNQSSLNVNNSWTFGDGASSSGVNSSHTFTTSNVVSNTTYTTQLLVESANGCKDSITKTITLFPKPKASFSVDTPACSPKTLSFTNTSSGATNYNWNFGNSNSSTAVNPTQQYVNTTSSNQTYTVQLIASNSSSCSDTVKVPVIIRPKPNYNIVASPDSGCAVLSVSFQPVSGASSYSWSFGDGNTSTQAGTSHNFVNVGSTNASYTVQLIAADANGCKDTAFKVIKVFPKPVALFQANPTTMFIPNEAVNCTNQSTGNVSNYWIFGDGATSTDENPKHEYTSEGEYSISLIVTSNRGCKDTFELAEKIIVLEESSVTVPNAFTPNPAGPNGGVYGKNDLNNDVFHPVVKGVDKDRYEFMIYSRWGELLFQTKDVAIGWDGYYKGKLCTQDVYIWKISAITLDEKLINKTGDLLLLK